MEMKDENKAFKEYFENFSPDAAATDRMYDSVTAGRTAKKAGGRHMWKMLLAAALTAALSVFTVFAASPAVRQYFFPSLGIVEVSEDTGEEADPLYLVMDDTDPYHRGFTSRFGYWYDGTVRFWIESHTDYSELDPDELLEGWSGTIHDFTLRTSYDGDPHYYCIEIPDITAAEAREGIVFNGVTVRFTKAPKEYATFSVENDGIRLTLIPMTQDNATFGYFLEYTDGRPGTLKLSNGLTLQPSAYDYYSKIQLQTDTGELYDLIHYGSDGINLLTTDREVRGIGTKILCEELFLYASFKETDPGAILTLPLPEVGETLELNMDFTFPDGTKGRIVDIARSTSNVEDTLGICDSMDFIHYTIDYVTDNGRYASYDLLYPDEISTAAHEFVQSYNQKYDLDFRDPRRLSFLGYYRTGSAKERQAGIDVTLAYLNMNTGAATVDLALTGYSAAILGDWNMDLTLPLPETAEIE